jgi:hypothetical protein
MMKDTTLQFEIYCPSTGRVQLYFISTGFTNILFPKWPGAEGSLLDIQLIVRM